MICNSRGEMGSWGPEVGQPLLVEPLEWRQRPDYLAQQQAASSEARSIKKTSAVCCTRNIQNLYK